MLKPPWYVYKKNEENLEIINYKIIKSKIIIKDESH